MADLKKGRSWAKIWLVPGSLAKPRVMNDAQLCPRSDGSKPRAAKMGQIGAENAVFSAWNGHIFVLNSP
jgi:hypothetical protein